MKPRTKFQKRIWQLHDKLRPISEKKKQWAYEYAIQHIGREIKKYGITCVTCGHTFKDKQPPLLTSLEGYECPACGRKLKVERTRKETFNMQGYLCILSTCHEFQVIRFFTVDILVRLGKKKYRSAVCHEVLQRWIAPDGRNEIIAKLQSHSFGYYNGHWNYTGRMEIRKDELKYNIYPNAIHPVKRIHPILQRNGLKPHLFSNNFQDVSPFKLFQRILTDSMAETMLKAKQYRLLEYYIDHPNSFPQYWASVKICIRNRYIVPDAGIWKDYIDLLNYFNKDVRNAKYVCPVDLHKAHNKLVARKRKQQLKEKLEKMKKELPRLEKEYRMMRKHFFDLHFTDGTIHIRLLRSVKEFMEEGDMLGHCVYTNEYYKKEDSLVFSAQVNGVHTETIQFSLSQMKITQCRGYANQDTMYHHAILRLFNENKHLIAERISKEKTKKTRKKEAA